MWQALLIFIGISLTEGITILFLIKALVAKREKQISDHNETVVTRELVEQQIKDKYQNKEDQLEKDIKKAKSARDFLDIIAGGQLPDNDR